MAKTTYTMRALRTFEGNEGLIRRGDVFTVENKERVDELKRLQLAEDAEGQDVTNVGQLNAQNQDASRSDLETQATELDIDFTDDTKDEDLRTAISRQREMNYINASASNTEGTQNANPAVGGGTTGSTSGSTSSTTTSGDSSK